MLREAPALPVPVRSSLQRCYATLVPTHSVEVHRLPVLHATTVYRTLLHGTQFASERVLPHWGKQILGPPSQALVASQQFSPMHDTGTVLQGSQTSLH